jgi:RNA polymerase sigma factor (sigma-70 family)
MNLLDGLPKEPWTRDQENRAARSGKESLLNEMILRNMREALFYARKIARGAMPDGELFSTCYAALKKATKTFKPGKIRFFAYCKVFLRGAIALEWKSKDVVARASLHETPSKPKLTAPKVLPEDEEDEASKSFNSCDESQEAIEPESVDPDFQSIDTHERWALIQPLIKEVLNENEQMVLELHYQSGWNFERIGETLGVTRSGVRETHLRALKKVRCALLEKGALFDR